MFNLINFYFNKPEYLIGKILTDKHLYLSTAESCTGGLISSRLTDVSGSSAYIRENYVTYSNDAKHKLLKVSKETLDNFGAVSEECAKEMAEGLKNQTKSDIVLCITGIAGPTGATNNKPVGTVFISIKTDKECLVKKFIIKQKFDRKKMKYVFSQKALIFLLDVLKNYDNDN